MAAAAENTKPMMCYIIGEPGVGKSSALALALAGLRGNEQVEPFAHTIYTVQGRRLVQLGKNRKDFSGTDALSMSVQPRVVDWLRTVRPPLVIAEGDRLANGQFFTEVEFMGYDLQVIALVADPATTRQRRAQRAATTGKAQNEAWLKGRISKVARLVASMVQPHDVINATWPVEDVADELVRRARVLLHLLGLQEPASAASAIRAAHVQRTERTPGTMTLQDGTGAQDG